jgi:hypothetical protein
VAFQIIFCKNLGGNGAFLVQEWSKIPQELLQAEVDFVPKRLWAVIADEGGYIE